ncbi:putative membrane protein [Shigella flexneri K-315]|uniref:Putative membrane protein n=1 Tax=Shigella flexneri K-315 TaxID=766150 RepID=I6CVM6_SHIFL|nr:putative membrane protein [Shigella flexneri K-315]
MTEPLRQRRRSSALMVVVGVFSTAAISPPLQPGLAAM